MAVTATPCAGNAARPAVEAGLSIVVPVFNEGAGLAGFHARLAEVARGLRQQRGLATEVIYVEDGSRDDSLAVAQTLPAEALDVQIVSLSRNFGKEAALLAGLDHARLGAVLFMDGDGQHPPALIPTLVGHWLDGGNDVVFTAKAHRANETRLRRHARGRGRLPPAVAARRRRVAAAARAQPLLQGAGELDRLQAIPGGL